MGIFQMYEKFDPSTSRLYTALNELVNEKSLDKISVGQIVSLAGVSRSTFYRNFYDKYALMNSYYDSVLEDSLYSFYSGTEWDDAVSSIYGVIRDNLGFYQNALSSRDMNCLKNHIRDISYNFFFTILRNNQVDLQDWKNVKIIQSYILGNLEIMELWIQEGMVEPIPEMVELMNENLPRRFEHCFRQS